MHRIATIALLVAFALTAASCGGESEPPPSPTPTPSLPPSLSPSTSPTPTPSPSPSLSPSPIEPTLQLPGDAPTSLDDPAALTAVAAGDPTPLAPPGSQVTHSTLLVTPEDLVDQIVLTWRRGDDPFAAEQGVIVWQRFEDSPRWRAVYAFTDRPRKGVLGIDLETHDLTGDGVPDAFTFEQRGGTGACGTWRVIASAPGAATEVFRRSACDTEIRIDGEALAVREAVFEPNDPHCCPSAIRYARLEWDGEGFVETSSEVVGIET